MEHGQIASPGNLCLATFPLRPAGTTAGNCSRLQRSQSVKVRDIVPAGVHDDFMATFERMDALFEEIDSIMRSNTRSQNITAQAFSATSVMTYINNGNGPPKVYHASTSTSLAPGGIRQTRKIIRDSQSGIEKVSTGFHIGDRARLIERSRNHRTGQQDEETEFININEDDISEFEEEWKRKTKIYSPSADPRDRYQKQPVYDDKLPFSGAFATSNPYRRLPALMHKPSQNGKPTSMSY